MDNMGINPVGGNFQNTSLQGLPNMPGMQGTQGASGQPTSLQGLPTAGKDGFNASPDLMEEQAKQMMQQYGIDPDKQNQDLQNMMNQAKSPSPAGAMAAKQGMDMLGKLLGKLGEGAGKGAGGG
jgi:hypothetical protein